MKQIHECTDGRGCRHINQNILNWKSNEKICREGHAIMILGRTEPTGCTNYEENPPESTLRQRIKSYRHNVAAQHHIREDTTNKLLRDIVAYGHDAHAENSFVSPMEMYKKLGIEE